MKRSKIKDDFRIAGIISSVLLGIYSVSLLVPIAWAMIMSVKSSGEYLLDKVSFPAISDLHFENYVKAFKELSTGENTLFKMFFNSVWYSVGATTMGLMANVLVGYTMALYKNKFTKLFYYLSMFVLLFPVISNLSGQFRMSKFLGWYDSPFTIMSNLGAVGLAPLIYRGIFSGIDKSYYESAYCDGAGHFTIAFRIMIPQIAGPAFAMWIMTFIALWNDAEGVLMFLPSYPTLMSGLYIYQQEATRLLNFPVLYAGLLMAATPLVILFAIFNKKIMSINISGVLK